MPIDHRIGLECTVCKNINYYTRRNKKSPTNNLHKRLEFEKFCKHCKKKTPHRETK